MIYEVVERAVEVFAANFATDMQALATAHDLPVDTDVTVYPRREAGEFAAHEVLPGLGVWSPGARTQAHGGQSIRKSRVTVVADYYARHADVDLLTAQVELAAEAILRSVDRMPDASGVRGAGEENETVRIEITGAARMAGAKTYEERVVVTFTMDEQDVLT